MDKDISEILDEVYLVIQSHADMTFPEFGFKRVSSGWEATDGTIDGDDARGHLYWYDDTPFCFKNQKTGEAKSVWKYVEETTGKASKDVLIDIARASMNKANADIIVANDFDTLLKGHKAYIISNEALAECQGF